MSSTARKLTSVSKSSWDFAVASKSDRKRKAPVLTKDNTRGALVDQVVEAKTTLKQAESVCKTVCSALISQYIQPEYAKHAANGSFTKSLTVTGIKTDGVMVVYQDRFIPIVTDFQGAEKELKHAKVTDLFTRRVDLKVKNPTPEVFAELSALLGAKLGEYFDVIPSLVPVTGMDQKQWTLPDTIRAKYCTQYAAAIRILNGGKDDES